MRQRIHINYSQTTRSTLTFYETNSSFSLLVSCCENTHTHTHHRPEGPDPPRLEYCSEASVATVNLPNSFAYTSVEKQKAQDGMLPSQLCIVQDNNPAYQDYFSDPGAGSSAQLR